MQARKPKILTFVVSLALHGSAAGVTDLTKVVTNGVNSSLALKNQKLKFEQTLGTSTSAYYDLLPTLSLAGSKTSATTQSVSSGAIASTSADTNSVSLAANWTIWDNYANIRKIQTTSMSVAIERLNNVKEINGYIISLLDQYLEHQVLLDKKAILKGLLEQSRWTLEESEALHQAGARTRLDAMDAEIQVLNTERDLRELESQISASQRALANLVNGPFQFESVDLLKVSPYFMTRLEQNLRLLRETSAQQKHPEYVLAKMKLEKSLMELRQTRLGYWPTTGITFTHTYDITRNFFDQGDGVRSGLHSNSLALSLSWKFWDWLNTSRTISSSEKDYEVSVNQFREQDQKSTVEIINLLDQYELNEKSIESSRLTVSKSEQQQEYSSEMYRLGRVTLIAMQQSNNRLFESKNTLAGKLKSRFVLAAKIINAAGSSLLPDGSRVDWIR